MKRMLFLCAMALLLTACSDPKEANKKNFTKAVQEYFDTQDGVCVAIPSTSVAVVDEDKSANLFYLEDIDYSQEVSQSQSKYNEAEVLVKLGLLHKEKVKKNIKPAYWSNDLKEVELFRYSISKFGEEFSTIDQSLLYGVSGRFCTGRILVTDIINFTEPSDSMGMKMSKVKFKIKLEKLADWVKDKELQEVYPINLDQIGSVEGGLYLVLTSDGWKNSEGI